MIHRIRPEINAPRADPEGNNAQSSECVARWRNASEQKDLQIGSDVEIARKIRQKLGVRWGSIKHVDGEFWRYKRTQWETFPHHDLRRAIHAYDGASYKTPAGEPSCVKLGKGRIDSILNELASICADPNFFHTKATGINCASGFIRLTKDGKPSLEPHDPNHRQRHTLAHCWKPSTSGKPPEDSMLFRLLGGSFRGDPDAEVKKLLIAEICGAAALGYATKIKQPCAIIFDGPSAENGKSQILDLVRGLLPKTAICCIPPARMSDERQLIGLVGKLLNASDELSTDAIGSDVVKAVVTGDMLVARDVYKSRTEFRSMALNVFATNNLPTFKGGIDRGVQRRLLVVPFNRKIPLDERVEHMGRRIAEEEGELLLALAVEGAARLIRQRNFTIPPSSEAALKEWIFGTDPVAAWLAACTETQTINNGGPSIPTKEAYEHFLTWAAAEGFDKLPALNGFVQRVKAHPGVEHKRTSTARLFVGLVIHR